MLGQEDLPLVRLEFRRIQLRNDRFRHIARDLSPRLRARLVLDPLGRILKGAARVLLLSGRPPRSGSACLSAPGRDRRRVLVRSAS
jgi:hypothetical protein